MDRQSVALCPVQCHLALEGVQFSYRLQPWCAWVTASGGQGGACVAWTGRFGSAAVLTVLSSDPSLWNVFLCIASVISKIFCSFWYYKLCTSFVKFIPKNFLFYFWGYCKCSCFLNFQIFHWECLGIWFTFLVYWSYVLRPGWNCVLLLIVFEQLPGDLLCIRWCHLSLEFYFLCSQDAFCFMFFPALTLPLTSESRHPGLVTDLRGRVFSLWLLMLTTECDVPCGFFMESFSGWGCSLTVPSLFCNSSWTNIEFC